MAKLTALPTQATDNAADLAQSHLPTEIPPVHNNDAPFDFASPTLPAQASDTALAHLPTEIPPPPPDEAGSHFPTLPTEATDHMLDHMSDTGIAHAHLPDWLLG
jgi:hypothetical protein